MAVTSAHDLFGVDPAEFVAARDTLARELKANGHGDAAVAVRALRRPSVPTWALNRVALDHAGVVTAMLTAAAEARAVQGQAIEGGADGDALRRALADRRAAVRDVLSRASEVIEASGRSAATQQRQLESTLTAVIASDRLCDLLRAGELVDGADDEPDDDLASLLSASVSDRKPAKKKAPARPSARLLAARQAATDAEKVVEHARKALDVARRKVEAATLAENDAQQAFDNAEAALDEARAALEEEEPP